MKPSLQNKQITKQLLKRYTGQKVLEFFYTVKRKIWPEFKYFAIFEW